MTADGVVGYINELGLTWSKVTTVLDSSCEIGAIVTRTQDVGVLDWDYAQMCIRDRPIRMPEKAI